MTVRQDHLDDLNDLRQRLDEWSWRAFLRFAPQVGDEPAIHMVEWLLAEHVGHRIDEMAPEGLQAVFSVGDSGVAYYDPGLDISDEVVKRLDGAKPSAPPIKK